MRGAAGEQRRLCASGLCALGAVTEASFSLLAQPERVRRLTGGNARRDAVERSAERTCLGLLVPCENRDKHLARSVA